MNKIISSEYKEWLKEIKQKFQSSQIKASIQVNSTLLEFYWNLGNEIVEKQKNTSKIYPRKAGIPKKKPL